MPENQIIDLTDLGSEFVIHFGGEPGEINAKTFANCLLSICGVIDEIDNTFEPDFRVEVKIEALGQGSFRTRLKAVPKHIKEGILDKEITKHPMVVAIATVLLAGGIQLIVSKASVITKGNNIIIEGNNNTIIVHKEVYENCKKLENNVTIKKHVRKNFKVLEKDKAVTEFGITKDLDDKELKLKVLRDDFYRLINPQSVIEEEKIKKERINLRILRAVLERGSRKWQFYWGDIKISAPIIDEAFFDKLEAKEISISLGDSLDVMLAIYQIWNKDSRKFENDYYEIQKVIRHLPSSG